MASLVSKPLAKFRRAESPLPLHSRWGDAAISVPTDGSWSQYDNPHHHMAKERQSYGPGFVPDIPPDGVQPSQRESDWRDHGDTRNRTFRRNSISRLSIRLSSRPRHQRTRGESPADRGRESLLPEYRRTEFSYMPIQHDYLSEMNDNSKQITPTPFRYIPVSTQSPRSQSARTFPISHSRRDSFADSVECRDRDAPMRRGSHQEDNHRSLKSSLDENSNSSSRRTYGPPPRRCTSPFVAADRKRSSSLKPMTLTMVPDPGELY
ncbi:hypothetical protein N7495_006859 [Penicillium taxi]|uniref:uncharacterized protein n=1 Tax=Penicillium taxi TaxID=168475 RepID=UPI002544F4ED|nr:uncharacterized protein N7495_006859 [Penicillium taxi]KAJ5895168.1 hypothetical protein N7495_006859 [Penicillium taxi]